MDRQGSVPDGGTQTCSFVVELPGIEPDALPGNMPSEVPVRYASIQFGPHSLLAVSFSGLDGVEGESQLFRRIAAARPDGRQAMATVLLGRIIGFVAMAVLFAYYAYTVWHL